MFWENYVSLCADKGVSPNAVAAELHLSSGSVTAWKGGAVPRETTLRKIASYFDVSVDSLIGFGIKKDLPQTGEVSESKRKLLAAVDEMTDEQCDKMLELVLAAKKMF